MFMGDLDVPGGWLGIALFPRLGAHDARAIRGNIYASLQSVPGMRLPGEWRGYTDSLVIGADHDLLGVAFQRHTIPLVDQAHAGQCSPVSVRHNISFKSIVLVVRMTEENRGA